MMNIMMVGHRGAGKTAFMAGLYHCRGDKKSGYGVTGTYSTDTKTLRQLASNLSKGYYPEATDKEWETFDLALLHNGNDVLDFKWTDHRGGILTDYRGDIGTQQQFLDAVGKADALIVFLDGVKMMESNDIGHLHLMTCIDKALSVSHSGSFPICFVLTKWDMVSNKSLPGLNHWNNIFEAIHNRNDIKGMFIKSSIPSDGCIAPYHCMIFCLAYGIDIYVKRSVDRQETARKNQLKHEADNLLEFSLMGLEDGITKLVRFFGGSPSPSEWEQAGKEREKQAKEVAEQEKLKEYGKRFRRMIKSWKEEL